MRPSRFQLGRLQTALGSDRENQRSRAGMSADRRATGVEQQTHRYFATRYTLLPLCVVPQLGKPRASTLLQRGNHPRADLLPEFFSFPARGNAARACEVRRLPNRGAKLDALLRRQQHAVAIRYRDDDVQRRWWGNNLAIRDRDDEFLRAHRRRLAERKRTPAVRKPHARAEI